MVTALICLGWVAFVAFLAACWYGICHGETRPDPTPQQHETSLATVESWRPL